MSAEHPFLQEMPDGLERHAAANTKAHGEHCAGSYAPEHDVTLNDALIAYLLRVQSTFELLRDAASQTAAILVLVASGSSGATAHPMLAVVEQSEREVRERLSELAVPAGGRHGHLHLSDAAEALRAALSSIRAAGSARVAQPTQDLAQIYGRLQNTLQELRFAAGCLPGLELVSVSESCACHARFAKGD
ncbi:hypothetical protein WJ542_11395 [Paraburkholderia sp. B3]|uniref:hypothetical protein n=1 Tax=Paraburkholderia sp. B3 TaxID=3134791 RepID=UPI0039826ACA